MERTLSLLVIERLFYRYVVKSQFPNHDLQPVFVISSMILRRRENFGPF